MRGGGLVIQTGVDGCCKAKIADSRISIERRRNGTNFNLCVFVFMFPCEHKSQLGMNGRGSWMSPCRVFEHLLSGTQRTRVQVKAAPGGFRRLGIGVTAKGFVEFLFGL